MGDPLSSLTPDPIRCRKIRCYPANRQHMDLRYPCPAESKPKLCYPPAEPPWMASGEDFGSSGVESQHRASEIIGNTIFGNIDNLLSQGHDMDYIAGHYTGADPLSVLSKSRI